MTQYAALYQQALANGSLSDPAVKQVVEAMATQLGSAADVISTEIVNDWGNPAELSKKAASKLSHGNSGNICNAGNNKDTGVKCL